ncbi:hypothetical protein AU377_07945 [Sporosarcina sp. HYO08]|nr:hypothetical protein AU377_07945 [Sporosarcina sp. HYO08]
MVVLLAVSSIGIQSAQAATPSAFKDVSGFKKEIEFLTGKEIIYGFNDGTFRPNLPITRVQAVQMIMREMKPEGLGDAPNPNFKDIKPGNRGYAEIAKAVELGIISGKSKDRFDPTGNLTRAEMAKILANAYGLGGIYPKGFTDVSTSYWAYPFISALAANNITVGYKDGTYLPSKTIDRAQFSAFMARIIEPSFRPYNVDIADSYLVGVMDAHIIDSVMDPVEPIIYFLDGSTNEVAWMNLETLEGESVELPLPAERIAYANGKIYVTQLKGKHNSNWWDEDQQGAFAVVDVTNMEVENVIHIDLDPYDIAADDNGIVYISPGSGQHSRIESFDSKTGKLVSSKGMYQSTLIEMHPSQSRIYAVTTTGSPRRIGEYTIENGVLSSEQRSPYHGTYGLSPDLTITPDGKYLFNGTGHIFRSSATASSDMLFFGKLDRPYSSIVFDLQYGEFYTANKKNIIQAYDYTTMEPIGQLKTYGTIDKMFYDESAHMLLAFTSVKLGNSTVPFTGIEYIYFDVDEE